MSTRPQADPLVIVGAGVMGTGIAALALGYGQPVVLVDIDAAALDAAHTRVRRQLQHGRLLDAFPDGAVAELVTSGSVGEGFAAAGTAPAAVIEAVVEDAATKVGVLADVARAVPAGTALITNTSSIPIAELAAELPHPDRLVGVHFMNPTYLVPMTELVRGPRTSEATVASVTALLAGLGRRTTTVRDAPGFVTSRLLHPMINDAVRVVEAGTAGVEEVDALMEGCLGHPTGPLRTADLIGLDNLTDALRVLAERTGLDSHQPSGLLLSKVAQGHLGRKSGRGFYEYGDVLW